MNFASMEESVYGGNLEEDAELLAELAAIQEEELGKQRRSAPAPPRGTRPPPPVTAPPGLDPKALAAALADDTGDGNDDADLEMDDELLNELAGLVGGSAEPPKPPPVPVRTAAPVPQATLGTDNTQLDQLRQLHAVYSKMHSTAEKGGESAKARRYKRAVDKLVELIAAVQKGKKIDANEIPVAPPNFSFEPTAPQAAATAQPSHHPPAPPIRQAAHTSPPAPPVPERKAPAPVPKEASDPRKAAISRVLNHRRNLYVANGKAAIAAGDKEAAKEAVGMAKAFDQAIAALEQCSPDEMDMNDVPPSPPPYRKSAPAPAPAPTPAPAPAQPTQKPANFIEALQQRQQRYQQMARKAKADGNERKERMNSRLADQYAEAIKLARAGKPVAVAELPTLPDMPPLPPQQPTTSSAPKTGPLAPSGQEGKSRNQSQLEFLLQRQAQFKQAAVKAKAAGDVATAKKYLLEMKGFDKMIEAAQAGLPVSIKNTPIPPQATTSSATLEPRVTKEAGAGIELVEKTLIDQTRLAEQNQMRFTRLGDVGKVRMFEAWAKTARQDLLLIREVAKRGLNMPKFHWEMRQIPSADLFPDLAEDVVELTILSCKDVPLPSGYEPHHANLFVRYTFPPVISDEPQTGKTKLISGSTSPVFKEIVMLQIGSGRSRNSKLQRAFKRGGLKLEVYQKGGFMRSDKLLGTCEWKLEKLESCAELEESLPLKDGRKAVGGLLSAKIRIREPIGDAKAQNISQKWLVLDA